MAVSPADIEYGLALLKGKQAHVRKRRAYYDGLFDLSFVPKEARPELSRLLRRLGYNRCRAVVDAFADRLTVTGWEDASDGGTARVKKATELWQRANLDERQNEVIKEALRCMDSYVIVWPGDDAKARIHPNKSHLVTVVFDDDDPDEIAYAVKCWRIDRGEHKGKWRVTVYDATSITRYITESAKSEYPTTFASLTEYADDAGPVAENPYGMVPVVHFGNDADTGEYGHSELDDVIPLQDGVNNSVVNQVYGEEFIAYPQKWVKGIDGENDPATGEKRSPFRSGMDAIWFTESTEAAFGQFDPGDMGQFVVVQDAWDMKISRVSTVPVHWLNQTGGFPSGEALKTAESPFVAKTRDRIGCFTGPWKQVMALALVIEGEPKENLAALAPTWQSPESRSEREMWEIGGLKIAAQIPPERVWAENGYSQDEIAEMVAMRDQQQQRDAERDALAFARAMETGDTDRDEATS